MASQAGLSLSFHQAFAVISWDLGVAFPSPVVPPLACFFPATSLPEKHALVREGQPAHVLFSPDLNLSYFSYKYDGDAEATKSMIIILDLKSAQKKQSKKMDIQIDTLTEV